MRRRLFTILSALSLVLCAATVVLGLRGHFLGAELVTISRGTVRAGVARAEVLTLASRRGMFLVDREVSEQRFADMMPLGSLPASHVRRRQRAWEERRVRPWTFQHEPGRLPGHARMASRPPPRVPFEFRASRGSESPGQRFTQFRAPFWALVLVTGICPGVWLARRVRAAVARRRQAAGVCAHCRFDLTGNTSGTCPECGTPVPARPDGIGVDTAPNPPTPM